MFPCSDWATTPILENIPDSLGDIERVKTQEILVRNGIMIDIDCMTSDLSQIQ